MCAVAVVASLLVDVPEAAKVVFGDQTRGEAWGELVSDLLIVALAVVGTAGVLHFAGVVHHWYTRPRHPRPLSAAGLRFQSLAGDIRSVMYSTQRPDEFRTLLEPVELSRKLHDLGIPCPPDGDSEGWRAFTVELLPRAETGNIRRAKKLLAEIDAEA